MNEAVSRHEAGHAAVAQWLRWASRGVTVDPGSCFLGCARFAPPDLPESAWEGFSVEEPFAAWNPQVRQHFEQNVMCLLAGQLAELALVLLAPPAVARQVPSVAEQAVEQVETLAASLPVPAPADVAVIRKMVNSPGLSDADQIANLAWAAHGHDLATTHKWLSWLEASTRSLIIARHAQIDRLASVLMVRGTLSGEAVSALLAG